MKIAEQTASRLVYLEKFDGWIFNFCRVQSILVASFAVALLTSTVYSAGTVTLNCIPIEPTIKTCEQRRTHFFGLVQGKPQSLGQLTQTTVVTETDSEGDTFKKLYGINRDGKWEALALRRNFEVVSNQINQYLANPTSSTLSISESDWFLYLPFGLALLLPLRIIFKAWMGPKGICVEVDKVQGYLRMLDMYGKKLPKVRQEIALDHITTVQLVEKEDDDGDAYCAVMLQVSDAGPVVLKTAYGSDARSYVAKMVETLGTFLDVPTELPTLDASDSTEASSSTPPTN